MRILAIDGGGIRGIIPSMVLAELERRTGEAVCDLFDYLVGTSTGGVVAMMLATPGDGGRPRFRAAQLVDFYREYGPVIFPPEHFAMARQLLEEKYPAAGLEAALEAAFGEVRLSEALVDVMVPTYDAEQCEPVFLRRWLARAQPEWDLPMRLAARATAAAPTYFAPLVWEQGDVTRVFVDGGLVANNPVVAALALAHEAGGDVDSSVAVSLGTGDVTHHDDFDEPRHRGVVQWAAHVFPMVMNGTSAAMHHHAGVLIGQERYHRFQLPLVAVGPHLDDARPQNIDALVRDSLTMIEKESERLDRLAELLAGGAAQSAAARAAATEFQRPSRS